MIVMSSRAGEFSNGAAANQQKLRNNLQRNYDFIVCGAGTSGSVVARRLAENPEVSVLLIEAGGSDEIPSIRNPLAWPQNLGGEADWGFVAEASPHLNGRSISMSMGRVLGGGSSINVMVWARGHRRDWDRFAEETGDESWGYDATAAIFKQVENWQGVPDPEHRGEGGPVYVAPTRDPGPAATAMLQTAAEMGIPIYPSQNGAMMEGEGGCALTDILVRDGVRHSIYRAYVYPYLDRPNLTVLTGATVARVVLERKTATGVELLLNDVLVRIGARCEVVLSTGAIQTPKILMLSGIGNEDELRSFDINVVQPLPGVGENLQDHAAFGCIWPYHEPIAPRSTGNEATLYWKSDSRLAAPDLLFCQAEFPVPSPETARLGVPQDGWTMFAGLAQPKSRGRIRLRSTDPTAAPLVEMNMLSHPDDVAAAVTCIELACDIGNSAAFRSIASEQAIPRVRGRADMEQFARDAAVTYWHQTCSAKMGLDRMSVVDSKLKVYGINNLRIADGSVLPYVTTGNTMAPCVIVGEKAASLLRVDNGLQ